MSWSFTHLLPTLLNVAHKDIAKKDDHIQIKPNAPMFFKTVIHLFDYHHLHLISGQEKKRCLYVKYLPEGTTKEFLKVLFPVANNLDILTTGEGRR